ncbi:MAG: hypothetical protein H6662_02070 [Ardenticatenaceae bacterium]|nr:hypothetical protein [Ardenticatenaceae bacterium]
MLNIHKLPLADFLSHMRTVLDNVTSSADLGAAMAAFGYDAARLQEGQTLLDDLIAADVTQVKEYADQYAATVAINQAQEDADKTYGLHRALAKRLFSGNKQAQRELLLSEPKPTRRAEWLRQANIFYTRLLATPAFVTEMGKFGQTQVILEGAATAVTAIAALDSSQQKETAEAQEATRQRDDIWSQARVWLVTLTEVAQFALADQPQLLEALDVVKPS